MKKWENSEDIQVSRKREKREPARVPSPSKELPKKVKKVEEVKLPPAPKEIREERKVQTPVIISHTKIQAHEVIPLLHTTLVRILQHNDPNKVSSAELATIEACLEEIILQEVPMQVLVDSKVGILVKQFYDFVRKNPQLRPLGIIARCAFKKLKKRVCEVLFGVTKTLPYSPPEEIIVDESIERPKVKVKATPNVPHLRDLPQRIKRKEKAEGKEAKITESLRNRQVSPRINEDEIEENVHKPPVNPELARRVTAIFKKLLEDVRGG